LSAAQEILDAYGKTRGKTIELLEAVPEEWLERMPESGPHGLGRLFQHIARADTWWMTRVMRDGGAVVMEADGLDKVQVRQRLRDTQQRVASFFAAPGSLDSSYDYQRPDGRVCPLSGAWCLLYLIEHEVHHRGQAVQILRQWGFDKMPFFPYSGWD
jgi:uncharacterized damage-inducible protein DinB